MKKIITLILTLIFLNVLVVCATDIDIGSSAIQRSSNYRSTRTTITELNPANATGIIDTIEIYMGSSSSDLQIGIFYSTGTNQFSTRDYVSLGAVNSGYSSHTVELNVEEGDYIGFWCDNDMVSLDTTGGYYWTAEGDNIPCTSQSFTYTTAVNRTFSIYATGTTSAGVPITFNGATISKWNDTEITKWNGVE